MYKYNKKKEKKLATMAPSISRRRSVESPQIMKEPTHSNAMTNKSSSLSISPTFILLILLTIWCTSTLLSSSFHICVSSRKLDLYCISGGLNHPYSTSMARNGSSEALTVAAFNVDHHIVINSTAEDMSVAAFNAEHHVALNNSKGEIENAYNIVREQLHIIRSRASVSGINNNRTPRTCDGRGVFVYDLPTKFNKELLSQCKDLLPWTDLCEYFDNEGKGQAIQKLGKSWYQTHQYSVELIFHSKVLKHPCRIHDPDEAKLFYVPFYGGLDILRYHFKQNVSTDTKDSLGNQLIQYLQTQSTWWRNMGKDHMFVLGKISWDFRRRDGDAWGSNFLLRDEMRNAYKFLIERHPWEVNDIGIPHPTHFHPRGDGEIEEWQGRIWGVERRNLVSFVGAARPGQVESIRDVLIKSCDANGGDCRFLDCNSGGCKNPEDVIMTFTESEFCLQPPGDSPTRKSVFDSLIAGCIPVLFDPFTAYYQYPWHLPENYTKYSVFTDKEEVREGKVDVVERLRSVSIAERKEMKKYIVYELMPGLVYGDSSSEFVKFRDAFGIVMDNMMDLVTKQKG